MDSRDLRKIAEAYTLTQADKTGNTKAWQDRDKKNVKTGEPLYTKADHLKKEGYQRNPERDTRSARQRRMDDPDTGINSQAFRDFMAAQQRPAKKKPVAKKKDSK